MKISIWCEKEDSEEKIDCSFSIDGNLNFVEITIEDKVYTVYADEFFEAALTFNRIRDNEREKNKEESEE